MFIDRDVVRLLYNVFRTVHERWRFIVIILGQHPPGKAYVSLTTVRSLTLTLTTLHRKT